MKKNILAVGVAAVVLCSCGGAAPKQDNLSADNNPETTSSSGINNSDDEVSDAQTTESKGKAHRRPGKSSLPEKFSDFIKNNKVEQDNNDPEYQNSVGYYYD
ncbi:MAG: hypothetical protein K6F33_06225 [Bacteroidales bacterium]|nr:hypothetical protein [Bacteroidales bacterium]